MTLCACPSLAYTYAGIASTAERTAPRTNRLIIAFSSVFVRRRRFVWRNIASTLQKILFRNLLPDFGRRSRIQRFHLLDIFRGQLRQATHEVHELPARGLALLGSRAPSGHPGEAHTVLDDPEELAVRQALGPRQPHVRGLGPQPLPHLGVAAAVISMTDRTMI